MKWLNLELQDCRSPEMLASRPAEIGRWLLMMAYSADQESGGRLNNASTWTPLQWAAAGIDGPEAVRKETRLWRWEGDDVVLKFYPLNQEQTFRRQRDGGRKGGKRSGEVRRSKADEGVVTQPSSTSPEAPGNTSTLGNNTSSLDEKKRNGKETKGKCKGNRKLRRSPSAANRAPRFSEFFAQFDDDYEDDARAEWDKLSDQDRQRALLGVPDAQNEEDPVAAFYYLKHRFWKASR